MSATRSLRIAACSLLTAMLVLTVAPIAQAQEHDHDDHVHDEPAGSELPITSTPLPSSTSFDPANPAPESAALAGRLAAEAAATCTTQRTALIQDNVPWVAGNSVIDPNGLGANAIELDAQGIDYCVLNSSDIGSFDLSQFDRIIVSGAQNQGFYDNLFVIRPPFAARTIHIDIENFVSNGGTLVASLTDRASGPGNGGSWNGRNFIDGVTYNGIFSDDNTIVTPTHPVINGQLPCLSLNCGRIIDLDYFQRFDVDGWGFASHGSFVGLPANATVLLADGNGPALAEYSFGSGTVLISMITTEFRYLGGFGSYIDNRKLLANILSYQYQPDCTDDNDCDGIPNATEVSIGTDPDKSDTDGDGLIDPWEVDPSVEGAGFKTSYPDGADLGFSQEDVFGPFGGPCYLPDASLRIQDQMSCLNTAPDPLHVDAYFELDWQDCQISDCPEVFGLKVDPIHHSPNLPGLGYTNWRFSKAPISNPDGTQGVNLHYLIDERIGHWVNCDTNTSEQAREFFGTPEQRANPEWLRLRAVRRQAVRYIWSGHSTLREDDCPLPNTASFIATGFGLRNLEAYDFSPHGDVNIGGNDVLLSLGPIWNCPAILGVRGRNPGPCYNATEIVGGGFGPPATIFRPGIFPTEVNVPSGEEIKAPYPIARMIGLTEADASVQLWERAIAHLIGHAFGLRTETEVGNRADATGLGAPGSKTVRPSELYNTEWSALQFAPNGSGIGTLTEPLPDYLGLAAGDADGDGTPEGQDNCPGIPNPDQDNEDIDEFGDACDGDTDGDGLLEGRDEGLRVAGFSALGRASEAVSLTADDVDPFPNDTDNDGQTNDIDPDDDGDGIDDGADNCRIVFNPSQDDRDGDGQGDACDRDDDGDAYPDEAETLVGSDPLDPASTWELLGWNSTCSDGVDNDLDGTIDGGDLGCTDADGDGNADLIDNCPTVYSTTLYDTDGDGLGDICDTTPNGEGPGELWFADGNGLYRIDTDTLAAVAVDDGPEGAVVVAYDQDQRTVWTYGDRTLRNIAPDGSLLTTTQVPNTSGNQVKVALEIGARGDVWLAVKNDLFRFASDGSLLGSTSFNDDIVAMALDATAERMWVAQKRSVVLVDGTLGEIVTVDAGAAVFDIAVDDASTLWVAARNEVRSYSRSGLLLATAAIGGAPEAIAVGDGVVFVAIKDDVVLLDARGGQVNQIVDVLPANSGPKITDLVAGDESVWVSDGNIVVQIDADGVVGDVIASPANGKIRSIEVVGNGTAQPRDDSLGVLILSPGATSSSGSQTITVTGYTNEQATITVAGFPAIVDGDLRFEATVTLPGPGLNLVEVIATNAAGDTATASIDVIVDSDPPAPPVVDNVRRVTFNNISISGSSEPGALIEVRNTTVTEIELATFVTADDSGRFAASLPAASGHTVTLYATDAAGNRSGAATVVGP